ncbi:MAG: DUF1116 domain-containing protein [Adlercreutzia sp.]|nr:DUF1116 domain-containing protein [Adlercreutzia sp.]
MTLEEANARALEPFQRSDVRLTGMALAKEVIPGMHEKLVLHAGPPIEWERMCGPMRGAVLGALIYEGLANNEQEALSLVESGEIEFSPNHEHQAVGPMAGVITAHMPVFIMENVTYGTTAFSNVCEGQGKCLRFGAFDDAVIARMNWLRDVFYPIMGKALELSGGLDYRGITVQAVQMGDDNHNRNKASTALLIRDLAKYFTQVDAPADDVFKVIEHLEKTEMFNVNLTMAMAKTMSLAASGVKGSTIVTVMARNGVDFGIKVSGLGDQWFVAQANYPEGLYFPGYSQEDAARDIGDSAITETFGMGGFSLAAAPAIVQLVGGTVSDGIRTTNEMYEITAAENDLLKLPTLDFRGSPTGIDILKVLKTGIEPTITTGMAHKDPGIGQVGAGLVKAPIECFRKAAGAFLDA